MNQFKKLVKVNKSTIKRIRIKFDRKKSKRGEIVNHDQFLKRFETRK
jgi:hypothetical protein